MRCVKLTCDTDRSPRCTWLVRPPFEVTRVAKISVNWPAFYVSSEDGAVPSRSEALQLCGTAFKAWDFDGNDLLDGLSKGPLPRGLPHWGRSDDRRKFFSSSNNSLRQYDSRPFPGQAGLF